VDDIIRLSRQQLQMLENVSRYIKKRGRLVYSTCTIEPEENEGVVESFLANHHEFTLEDASDFLPMSCESLVDGKGYLKTLPSRDGIDGFFGARLKRLF
jgi:16S rRNA (cytosine967-C5)-methyltransferase